MTIAAITRVREQPRHAGRRGPGIRWTGRLVELAVEREQATHHRQREQVEPVQDADDQQDAGDPRRLVLELRGVHGLRPSSPAGAYRIVNMMYEMKIR